MNSGDFSFTSDWTLFLDRDGVINRRIPGGYVTRWEEFEFLPGVPEALKILSSIFAHIIVVSNQQGIGKGLMTKENLLEVDNLMKETIKEMGGWIDASYYAPFLENENHPDRKPGTGMGLRAKADFPEIDFAKSIMAGDSPSDMIFGKSLGMATVFIGAEAENSKDANADIVFPSLYDFATSIHRYFLTSLRR